MAAPCIIFDIGGVLEQLEPARWDRDWEERLGLAPGEVERRLADVWQAGAVGAVTEAEVRSRISADLGLDTDGTEALLADLWAEYLGSANEELISYIRTLGGSCRLGILSNSFVGAREREEEAYGFAALVGGPESVVYSHEIGVEKPQARAFELACRRLDVRAEDCLFVDDARENVEAAQAAGMHGLLHTGNEATVARIAAYLATAG